MKAAVVSGQGPRAQMEDAHFLDIDFDGRGWLYAGIYDGHGGAFAASFAARFLHRRFLDLLLGGTPPEKAFVQAYEAVSAELNEQDSGTTAVDIFIRGNEIVAANAGDARAIVVKRTGQEQLTVDHRVEDRGERERVERSGGQVLSPYVYRGGSGLMPTRTIGDRYFKPVGVIPTPSVSTRRVAGSDLMLVSACDGLWGFISNEEVAEFARKTGGPNELAESLKNEVLNKRGGSDNITVICLSLMMG